MSEDKLITQAQMECESEELILLEADINVRCAEHGVAGAKLDLEKANFMQNTTILKGRMAKKRIADALEKAEEEKVSKQDLLDAIESDA